VKVVDAIARILKTEGTEFDSRVHGRGTEIS